MKDIELRTSYFDCGNLILVPLTLSGKKGSFWHLLIEEIKLICVLYNYNLKIFPKYRNRLA